MKTFYESISGIQSLSHSLAIVIILFSSYYLNAQTTPTVTTTEASNITSTTATSGGNVTSDGGATVTARGVCWSTSANPTIASSLTIDGTGTGTFSSTITGLTINTLYYVRAYATNTVGTGYGNEVNFSTPAFWSCGLSMTINHLSGAVAPVNKTVTYGTVTNVPGESAKCWITSNLGADHQATAVDDATEPSAGWYWQFNRKQGYKHDGITRTPNTTWITQINEDLDWQAANDPCNLELGSGWRIPTSTEWTNVDASGNWTNWNGPWNSVLKMHASGAVPNGSLDSRGTWGYYWSSKQNSTTDRSTDLYFSSWYSGIAGDYKAYGFTLRCIKDATINPTVNTTAVSNISQTTALGGGNVTSDGGGTVTARGVCWSTSQNPTVSDSHTTDGNGIGIFTSTIAGLTINTTYNVRAYATNSAGTAYGDQISFTSLGLIHVTSPNGGEIWLSGTVHPITWTASDVNNVKIEYSIDNGANWTVITSSTPATPGSYTWTVSNPDPNTLSVSCQVKVSSTTNATVFDLSDAAFTILNALKHAPITYTDTIEANNPADIAVPVMVEQFKKITGISLRLDYNPAVLTYTGSSNINGALGGLYINSSSVSPTLSKVIVGWSSSDPVTLADESKVVDIQFTHTSGATTLVWNNNDNGGQDCEYADSTGNPLADIPTTLFYRNGEVHSAPGWQLNGTLTYNNSAATPLDNVKIVLFQNTQRLDSVTTNSLGDFQFNQKQNGTYIIKPYTNKPWAGVNSTDAVKIQRHFTGLELLTEPVRLLAGDVNLSNFINTTDAVKVKRRFASLDTSFTRGNWTFAKPTTGCDTVIVNNANLTQNFYGLCVGDVNASNIPGAGAKSKGLLALEQNTLIQATPDEVVQIPVNVTRNVQIGAISLVIRYPEHLMRIKEVRVPHGTPFYTAGNGNLRLAWSETQPLILARGDTMMTLVVQISNQFSENDRITLSLNPESEVADFQGTVFDELILNAPAVIHKGNNGFKTPPTGTRFVVYPVPNDGVFTASITSSFTQTFEIMIYNRLGQRICEKPEITVIRTLDQQFDLRPLENGIYYIILRSKREVIARKILINH